MRLMMMTMTMMRLLVMMMMMMMMVIIIIIIINPHQLFLGEPLEAPRRELGSDRLPMGLPPHAQIVTKLLVPLALQTPKMRKIRSQKCVKSAPYIHETPCRR
jgi:hypothetical protein